MNDLLCIFYIADFKVELEYILLINTILMKNIININKYQIEVNNSINNLIKLIYFT